MKWQAVSAHWPRFDDAVSHADDENEYPRQAVFERRQQFSEYH